MQKVLKIVRVIGSIAVLMMAVADIVMASMIYVTGFQYGAEMEKMIFSALRTMLTALMMAMLRV